MHGYTANNFLSSGTKVLMNATEEVQLQKKAAAAITSLTINPIYAYKITHTTVPIQIGKTQYPKTHILINIELHIKKN